MEIEFSVLRDATGQNLPADNEFLTWVQAALAAVPELPDRLHSLAIRIVDTEESRRLNREFRSLDRATNVLSFTADIPLDFAGEMDILPGGESTDAAADRVAAAIRDQLDQRSRLLVVGHNTALRLGIARLLGLPSRRYSVPFDTLRPCHWAELDLSAASGPRLVA